MKTWQAVILAVVVLTGTAALAADPPKTISYQGYLKDGSGKPVTAPTGLVFRLYTSTPHRSNPVWSESQSVTPINGVYSVELGSVAPMNFYRGVQLYLGVTVGSGPELQPLQKLAAAPYSLALSLPLYQGISTSAAGFYLHNNHGPALQGTSNQPNVSAIYGRNHNGTGVTGESQFQTGVYGASVATGTGVWGWSQDGSGIKGGNSSPTAPTLELTNYDSTPGSLLLRGQAGDSPATVFQVTTAGKVVANGVQSSSASGIGVSGSSSADYGVWGQSSTNIGVYGSNSASGNFGYLGGSNYGAVGYSEFGTGVFGQSSTSSGVYGSSVSSHGVFGENTGASSGMAGVLGRASNTTGTTYGLLGLCDSVSSYAVQGTHVPTQNYGYLGSNGAGAYGKHNATGNAGTSGSSAAGIVGYAPGAFGIGVWGKGQLASGVGVKAEGGSAAVTATNLTNATVSASLATATNAGEFTGDVVVTGDTVVKGNIKREYSTGVNKNATPVAYATVASNGSLLSGTSNVSVTWNATTAWYEVTITGLSYYYDTYTTVVTAVGTTPLVATNSSTGGKLIIKLYTLLGASTQGIFQFVSYKP